jgi:hypothetical protein
MEVSRNRLARMLKEVAQELFQRAARLESSLKNSSMRPETEEHWFGEPRRIEINRLRSTGRQMLRRASELY